MKRKLWFTLLISMFMVFGLAAVASASPIETDADSNEIMPRYTFIESVLVASGIDGRTGYLSADVLVTTYETCKMTSTIKLQRQDNNGWTTVKTWNAPASGTPYKGTQWLFEVSTYVDTAETYRITATANVTSVASGRSESGTATQSRIPVNY